MFDKAFERMYKDKANLKDFELLKESVDESRAKTIFNDMKELFDVTIIQVKNDIEIEKEKLREAFSYIVHENKDKCEKKELIYFS